MIENIEKVSDQLKVLADAINAFTSEAVQLRIVDIVFGVANKAVDDNEDQLIQEEVDPSLKKKKKKTKVKPKAPVSSDNLPKKKPSASGQGPIAILVRLAEGGFFSTPQSMKSITEHFEVNLAKKIKQSDISGKLARMIREGTLTRAKNTDGQYEYSKA